MLNALVSDTINSRSLLGDCSLIRCPNFSVVYPVVATFLIMLSSSKLNTKRYQVLDSQTLDVRVAKIIQSRDFIWQS